MQTALMNVCFGGITDMMRTLDASADDPKRTLLDGSELKNMS